MSAAARAARLKRRPMDIDDASRLLRRSTLGVQYDQMDAVVGMRYDEWVEEQLNLPIVEEQAFDMMAVMRYPGFPDGPEVSNGWPANNQFLNWKLYQPETLRTRITYAVCELFSVGGSNTAFEGLGHHAVHWDNIESLVTTGTFRQLIERITRSMTMSRWLTYWRNAKTDGTRQPDENYGREILQLYTIGLWELHLNGERMKTGELDPSDPRYVLNGEDDVPTYGQTDITNMARVFTGMTARTSYDGGETVDTLDGSWVGAHIGQMPNIDSEGRMGWRARLEFAPSYHESSLPKVALQGRINVPIGTNGDDTLAHVLDALSVHPSTGPYWAGRMIRLLTTSNPSPEYVARVASVFRDDGTGQAGNMRAFFKAILLDQEAMAPANKALTTRVPSYEEQRFALVLSHQPALTLEGAPVAGGFGVDGPPGSRDAEPSLIGMDWVGPFQTFQNPSVFGRWPAGYSAGGPIFNAGLKSPEMATLTEGSITELFDSGIWFERIGNMAKPEDIADCHSVTGDRPALIERVSFLMTGGDAPDTYKAQVLAALAPRGSYFDTPAGYAETYRNIVAAFWLSPWGISRK